VQQQRQSQKIQKLQTPTPKIQSSVRNEIMLEYKN
jgi:hypothetical protein